MSFPYSLHTTTAVTAPGSYAFLSDADDLQSRSEPRPSTDSEALLIHQSDADGISRAAFYGEVRAGDIFDWVLGGDECYTRFTVTEVLPDPAGSPARKLFAIELRHALRWECDGAQLTDEIQPVKFRWSPSPWRMGPDGIRVTLPNEPLTGPGRYRLHSGSEVVIQIPAGMTIEVVGAGYSGGYYYSAVVDVESGAKLYFNDETGEVEGRRFPEGLPEADMERVNALFDQIAASVETPGWSHLYEPGWVGDARGDVAAVLGAGDRDAAGEALRRSETAFSDEARAYLLELHAALNARTSPDERGIAVETVEFSNPGSEDGGRAVILTVGAASGGLPLPGGGVAAGALALCLVEEGGTVEVRLPAPLSACRVE